MIKENKTKPKTWKQFEIKFQSSFKTARTNQQNINFRNKV